MEEIINNMYQYFELGSFPQNEFRTLLLAYIKGIQFKFYNQLYRQIDTISMRSSIVSMSANISMANLRQMKLKQEIENVALYSMYIDHTLVVCNNLSFSSQLVYRFDEACVNIIFTMKYKPNQFNYLDLRI